ncbi:hypothetical protein AB0I94_41855, partial [Streptomyces sp. NPDC050147]
TARSTSDHPLTSPHPCPLNAAAATSVTGQPLDEEEALAAVHDLHALGLLWVDDDGAVWRSIPPGIPDPENAEWRMCDRVLVPQRKI